VLRWRNCSDVNPHPLSQTRKLRSRKAEDLLKQLGVPGLKFKYTPVIAKPQQAHFRKRGLSTSLPLLQDPFTPSTASCGALLLGALHPSQAKARQP
jgi:hypothetical protein